MEYSVPIQNVTQVLVLGASKRHERLIAATTGSIIIPSATNVVAIAKKNFAMQCENLVVAYFLPLTT